MPRNLMMKIRASTMLRGRSSLYHHHSSDLLYLAPYLIISRVGLSEYECDTIIPSQKSPWFRRPIIAASCNRPPYTRLKRALPFLTPREQKVKCVLIWVSVSLSSVNNRPKVPWRPDVALIALRLLSTYTYLDSLCVWVSKCVSISSLSTYHPLGEFSSQTIFPISIGIIAIY